MLSTLVSLMPNAAAANTDYTWLGCFSDDAAGTWMDLDQPSQEDGVAACANECADSPYFALRNLDECRCLDGGPSWFYPAYNSCEESRVCEQNGDRQDCTGQVNLDIYGRG